MVKRSFFPASFVLKSWSDLAPFYADLKDRKIGSTVELEKWLLDWSELDAIVGEDGGWRYIRMTCNLADEGFQEAYRVFVEELAPQIDVETNLLKKKLIANPYLDQLDKEKYFVFIREIKKDLEIFRPENVDLQAKLMILQQKYAAIAGSMTIQYQSEEYTLARASVFLRDKNAQVRETVYRLIQERRAENADQLNDLFTEMLVLRQQIATNAGFSNFRDYKFKAMGRFDYSIQDCFDFHQSIATHVVPLLNQFNEQRKKALQLDTLRPWDLDVQLPGENDLKPFNTSDELIQKTIACFEQVSAEFSGYIAEMKTLGRLDLDSRKGKAPGGYNYPLNESGVPFIFMNSVGLNRDLVTMVHEGGHAVHAFLSNSLLLDGFKQCPSEVAELASMSMELMSMEHWQVFYPNAADYKQACKEHIESIIRILPWIALVDQFQHWIYENPTHTVAERKAAWLKLSKSFGSGVIDTSGLEKYRENAWHAQLHIFEVPFYYIEYGIAQLGAISIWKNYLENKAKCVEDYRNALKLGYTKTIPEIYKTANIAFDFSSNNVQQLVGFLKNKLED